MTCNRMELNQLEWNGMEWNGMEWNGMEWKGKDLSEPKSGTLILTLPLTAQGIAGRLNATATSNS